MPDLEGKVLEGKYRLIRKLGSGGVGTVYEAVHVVIGQKVAIKILKPEFAGSPTLALRLVQEAKAASSIEHPSIIKVFDAGRSKDGLTYLVMELLVGEELSAHMKQSPEPLSPDEAVDITADVLDALVAAHARGIIHRDLKPENVFLTRGPHGQRWVKLLDFGIAKVVDHRMAAPRLTHAGTVVGTPFYMAPEHARGARDLDARVDVYAAGVMLFEMLTKRVPFDGQSYNEVLAKVLSDPFPRPRQFNDAIPEGLEALILRATAKDRSARFPSAAAFLEALEPFRPETPSTVFRLKEAAEFERERERKIHSGELEMLPEESVPTMVGEVPDTGRPPSVPPPPEPEMTEPSRQKLAVADTAAAAETPGPSLPPAELGHAETRRLLEGVARVSRPGSRPSPEPSVREAGTLAGSAVTVLESSLKRRVALIAGIGAVVLAVLAVVLWITLRPPPEKHAGASPTTVADAGTVAQLADSSAEEPAPSDAAGLETAPVAVVDVVAPPLEEAAQVALAPTDAAPVDAGPLKVTIRILGAPAGAKILVDGTEAPNPFQLDPSEAEHKLRVYAGGFAPFSTIFAATEDMAIAVHLTRQHATPGDAATTPDSRSGQLLPDPHLMPH